ncbi:bactericidal permeability-increasing protein-like [Trachinotus anak]|uniref:bactericidal permeability-increasing protein-like n=1 Tax=Trachinotus anak TaxID=443729 RepID=UPI0039F20C3D
MSLCRCLFLLAFIAATSGVNPGVNVRLTAKGLEYGRQLGMAGIQQKLRTIKIPDMSGKDRVRFIGKVKWRVSNMRMVSVGLPKSAVTPVPGTGIRMSISNAYLRVQGNWRVKVLRIIRKSGSFDLSVSGLSMSPTLAIKSDGTGRPAVSTVNCAANIGSTSVKLRGGPRWLFSLFKKKINSAVQRAMQKQICPLVAKALSGVNPQLKTLNVVAKVDKHAEIEYSMVSSPTVSTSSIDLSLKGEFYNIGKHQEPPFRPVAFSLPPQTKNMMYVGMSAFTFNSAGFVYHRAGVLSLNITDDMIPRSSPVRLNTRTLGSFIPEIARRFPGLLVKMTVKTSKTPTVTFLPNNMTVEAAGTVSAFAVHSNNTLSPLFVLNLDTSVSAKMFVSGVKLAGSVTLNRMSLTLQRSNVGEFQVTLLNSILQMVLRVVVIPQVNVQLQKGYPLPSLGKMRLVNTELQVLKDYMMIGTDVQFTG